MTEEELTQAKNKVCAQIVLNAERPHKPPLQRRQLLDSAAAIQDGT